MTIVGFTITRMLVEKTQKQQKGQITIKNTTNIKDLRPAEFSLGSAKQQGLKIEYHYQTNYGEDTAKIEIDGDVMHIVSPELTKKALDMWKKEKKAPPELMQQTLSHVLEKCTIQTLLLAKETGLPSPIPLPKVVVQNKEQTQPTTEKTTTKKSKK